MEKVRAIVTYAKPWEMEDEKTGKMRSGLTVEFYATEALTPVENDDDSYGYRSSKESLPKDCLRKIKEVPGLYELTMTLQAGAKQKLQLKLSDLDFVESI
jgi:hypothetical protein